jgi:hypothetical protein
MPLLSDERGDAVPQYIAHRPPSGWFPPTEPRAPFRLHSFPGANTHLLQTQAAPDQVAEAGTLLSRAATLEATGTARNGAAVLEVKVTNKTGHKLPTGYPGRRMWLHVLVQGRDGARLFESGAWTVRGGLECAPQPHFGTVSSPDRAVVYEAVLADRDGRPTTSLISARRFAKDNRILPAGFRGEVKGDYAEAIMPVGTAGDTGFRPGSHVSKFEVKARNTVEPLKVTVELVFQSVAATELERLLPGAPPELARELRLLRENAKPVVIARREFEIGVPNLPRKRDFRRVQP